MPQVASTALGVGKSYRCMKNEEKCQEMASRLQKTTARRVIDVALSVTVGSNHVESPLRQRYFRR